MTPRGRLLREHIRRAAAGRAHGEEPGRPGHHPADHHTGARASRHPGRQGRPRQVTDRVGEDAHLCRTHNAGKIVVLFLLLFLKRLVATCHSF